MIKKYTAYVTVIVAALSLLLAHVQPVMASTASHGSIHSTHVSAGNCQTACSVTVNKYKDRLLKIVKNKKNPTPHYTYLANISTETFGKAILPPDHIWTQSSWVPPDIVLLSGYHSSGL